MKATTKRLLALVLVLCTMLALGMRTVPYAQAAEELPEGIVYGAADQTTFVPAGYTYVFEDENGMGYTYEAEGDMYISERVLTAEEAEALAKLDCRGDSMVQPDGTVCKTFSAKEAAAYSQAVQKILSGAPVAEDTTVSLRLEAYGKTQQVPVMIVFDEAPVAKLAGMTVQLGEALGTAERQAVVSAQKVQLAKTAALADALGYALEVHNQFTLLANAVSTDVQYGDLEEIRSMEGVKDAYLMPTFCVPEIQAASAEEALAPNLKAVSTGMGANAAWDLGYRGEDMTVAVIDTGLYLSNPAFAQQPADVSRLAMTKETVSAVLADKTLHAEAMVEGLTADSVYYNTKIPFAFNYGDSQADFGNDPNQGHGTHVAGIIAGNLPDAYQEKFKMTTMGLAPEAQLVIMKVFDANGTGRMDSILAAVEDAIALGVDCANLSLGIASGPMYYAGITEIYDAAYEAGINVVVSAGNDAFTGYQSLWGSNLVETSSVSTGTLGMPGTFDSVLTVASAENSLEFSQYGASNILSWQDRNGERVPMEYMDAPGTPDGFSLKEKLGGQSLAMVRDFDHAEGNLVLYPFAGGNADEVAALAEECGAAGVILYVPDPESEYDIVSFSLTNFEVPFITIYSAYVTYLEQNPAADGLYRVEVTWNPSTVDGQMSSFSSWGPTDGLTLKPEITGIGGNVFSAYLSGFATASGTSMSSPAVAASATLVRQYLETTNLEESEIAHVVNCLLMSTATPIRDEAHNTLYFVRRQGAGMANPATAISSGAYIQVAGTNKAKLELGDDPQKTGVYDMTFEVVNFSDQDKTYTLDTTVLGQVAQGGRIVNGEVTYLTFDYARELEVDTTCSAQGGKVTVPANSKVEVHVTVTLPDAERAYLEERFPYGSYVEGFVQLLSEETPSLSVPFLAFYGDYGAAPVVEEETYETLVSDSQPVTTADQFHNAIWGFQPAYSFGHAQLNQTQQRYLGSTASPYPQLPAEVWEQTPGDYVPFYSQTAGISPNGDQVLDYFQMGLGLKRNAKEIRYTVTNNTTGEVLWEQKTDAVSKTYYSDTYGTAMYGGIFGADALSYDWLYDQYEENGAVYYNTNHCRLPNDTQVTIRAEVLPEYQEATPGVVEFTLNIDTAAPVREDQDFKFFSYTQDNSAWAPPEEYSESTQCSLSVESRENMYLDYAVNALVSYVEETDRWTGRVSTLAYASKTPGMTFGTSCGANPEFYPDGKIIFMFYDYAGNVSAEEVSLSDDLLEWVNPIAEKQVLQVGEKITLRNEIDTDMTIWTQWKTSDANIARIAEVPNIFYGGEFCVLEAVSPGTVTISAGFGNWGRWMKEVEITVVPNEFAIIQQPTSVETIPGETVTFAVRTTRDDSCAYQWQEFLADSQTWQDCQLPGAHTAMLQVLAEASRNGQQFRCVVTDSDGAVLESEAATLTILHHGDHTDLSVVGVKEATCLEEGYTGDIYCEECGTLLKAGEKTPALGHAFGEWIQVKAPTCTEPGEEIRICKHGCGATEAREISASCPSEKFVDVDPTKWYHDAVDFTVENGLFEGTSDVTFSPQLTMSRAMLATVLYRLEGEPEVSGSKPFTDLPDDAWYTDAICWAAEHRIIQGVGGGKCAPNAPVTREQTVLMLQRYGAFKGYDTAKSEDLHDFTDADRVSPWAMDAVRWAVAEGLLCGRGNGVLDATGRITRAEAAAILMRFMQSFVL